LNILSCLSSHRSIYAKDFRLYLRNQREFYPGSVGQGKAEESAFLPRKSRHPFSFSLVFTDQRVPLGAIEEIMKNKEKRNASRHTR
jgi:hypothetical protein